MSSACWEACTRIRIRYNQGCAMGIVREQGLILAGGCVQSLRAENGPCAPGRRLRRSMPRRRSKPAACSAARRSRVSGISRSSASCTRRRWPYRIRIQRSRTISAAGKPGPVAGPPNQNQGREEAEQHQAQDGPRIRRLAIQPVPLLPSQQKLVPAPGQAVILLQDLPHTLTQRHLQLSRSAKTAPYRWRAAAIRSRTARPQAADPRQASWMRWATEPDALVAPVIHCDTL